MNGEWVRKDSEGGEHGICREGLKKTTKTARIVGFMSEIRTPFLPTALRDLLLVCRYLMTCVLTMEVSV
jgi:hypothetical protein